MHRNMTKRTADESLVSARGVDDCRGQNKTHKPSPSEADGDAVGPSASGDGRAFSHRISSISSSSSFSIPSVSSCSAPTSASANTKPFRRTVTSIDSTVDDCDVDVQAGQKCSGSGGIKDAGGTRQVTRLINARILRRDGTLLPGSMNLSSGLIVGMNFGQAAREQVPSHDDDVVEVFDCQGQIISPGFIDIQLNGAYGVDFSNDGDTTTTTSIATPKCSFSSYHDETSPGLQTKDILHVAHRLVETGVTSFCPTMVSSSRRTYRRILSLMRNARNQQRELRNASNIVGQSVKVGANILGMHLEGPFFASSKRGAHDQQHIIDPVKGMASIEEVYGINEHDECESVSRLGDVDIITLAPELPGAFDAIQSLTKHNKSTSSAVVSCGHTEATYEDGVLAVTHGATLLTHLYNAMNPFHHRKPGLVGLLSSEAKLGRMGLDRPFYSMIVDGIHVHESAVCMAYKSHSHGCVLVTDAMTAMGLGDGEHSLGNMKVHIKGDRATLAGTDTLAGSVVSMDTCVQRFRQFTVCSIGEALLCATLHPAMVLKRHTVQERRNDGGALIDAPIGILEVGAKADLVLVNDELDVLGTWVSGRIAFQKK